MVHELKTDSGVFRAVRDCLKTYEIIKNDRNFLVDDDLYLRETKYTGVEMANGSPLIYTGKFEVVTVIYILEGPIYGLIDGWVTAAGKSLTVMNFIISVT